MRLRTFNRYHFSDHDISCGTVAVALITGETPDVVREKLNSLRRKKGWSENKIAREAEWTYWSEAIKLISAAAGRKRTVYPKNNLPLKKMKGRFKKGVFLVCTTQHLQVVKDGMIYDTCACQYGRAIELHPWTNRKVWYYCRLVKKG